MAKGKSTRAQRQAAAPVVVMPPPTPSPPPSRAGWFDIAISPTKLALARVAVFTILAVDALLQIAHAPRYGAGDFNVAHFSFLDHFAPGRASFTVAQLLIAYACGLVAVGVATRIALPIATATYAWVYFTSQLDSYQHHYLVILLLLLACFVPWQARLPAPPARGAVHPPRVRSWALRLILVQLAIVYLWAAVAKMDARWLDGSALAEQIKTGPVRALIDRTGGIKLAALGVLLTELTLAATIWHRRGMWIAWPLGVVLHGVIARSGLEIGLFAYIMLALYVLVLPDGWFAALDLRLQRAQQRPASPRWTRPVALAAVVAAVVLAALIAGASELDLPRTLALTAAPAMLALGVAMAWSSGPRAVVRLALAHVLAFALIVVAFRASDTAIDYYRFWGGAAGRLGDTATGIAAYRRITEFAPSNGNAHYQLGKLLLQAGKPDDAIAQFQLALPLEPDRARAGVALASYYASLGRTIEARTQLARALANEPTHPGGLRLRAQLDSGTAPGPTAPANDND